MESTGIPNTLESFPYSYMQSRNFSALSVQSATAYTIICFLLVVF